MEDLKTIQDILEQKKEIEDRISSMVDAFLRANPEVKDIGFTTNVFAEETRCGLYKEFSIRVDLTI